MGHVRSGSGVQLAGAGVVVEAGGGDAGAVVDEDVGAGAVELPGAGAVLDRDGAADVLDVLDEREELDLTGGGAKFSPPVIICRVGIGACGCPSR